MESDFLTKLYKGLVDEFRQFERWRDANDAEMQGLIEKCALSMPTDKPSSPKGKSAYIKRLESFFLKKLKHIKKPTKRKRKMVDQYIFATIARHKKTQ